MPAVEVGGSATIGFESGGPGSRARRRSRRKERGIDDLPVARHEGPREKDRRPSTDVYLSE